MATATRPASNDVIATGNGVEVAPNSVHVLATPAAIFNLQGQKMQEAKKGIQIVNGKKVMY